jgi:hypothetical protein
MSDLRYGFTSYIETGKFSPEFISDVDFLISKVYSKWKLYEDEEEFNSSCWTKIVQALSIYNDETSNLSTYLNWVVWNEATRIHSKHKRMSVDDITEKASLVPVWGSHRDDNHDFLHRDRVCTFARKAYGMGIFIDQHELYRNYLLGNLTPAVKAFMWYFILLGQTGYEH